MNYLRDFNPLAFFFDHSRDKRYKNSVNMVLPGLSMGHFSVPSHGGSRLYHPTGFPRN